MDMRRQWDACLACHNKIKKKNWRRKAKKDNGGDDDYINDIKHIRYADTHTNIRYNNIIQSLSQRLVKSTSLRCGMDTEKFIELVPLDISVSMLDETKQGKPTAFERECELSQIINILDCSFMPFPYWFPHIFHFFWERDSFFSVDSTLSWTYFTINLCCAVACECAFMCECIRPGRVLRYTHIMYAHGTNYTNPQFVRWKH